MSIEWTNYDNFLSEAREKWQALDKIKAATREWNAQLAEEVAKDLVALLQWDGLEIKSGDQLWYLNALLPFWYRINFIAEVAQDIQPGDTVVLDGEDVVVHRWDDCKTIGTCISPNTKTEKIWEVDLWEEEKIEYTVQAWDILSRVVNKQWVDQKVSWIRESGQLLADSLRIRDRVLIDTQAGEIHVNNILVGTFTAKEKFEQVRKLGEVVLKEVLVEPVEIDLEEPVIEKEEIWATKEIIPEEETSQQPKVEDKKAEELERELKEAETPVKSNTDEQKIIQKPKKETWVFLDTLKTVWTEMQNTWSEVKDFFSWTEDIVVASKEENPWGLKDYKAADKTVDEIKVTQKTGIFHILQKMRDFNDAFWWNKHVVDEWTQKNVLTKLQEQEHDRIASRLNSDWEKNK